MKVTLISTFFNEEDTIIPFLESVARQSRTPDEVILVDGGSTDKTLERISSFNKQNMTLRVEQKKGNRAVGRNAAITLAEGDIIACSDVGCILDKDWLEHILKPFQDNSVDVVAGYYQAKADTVFQKCVACYALVMPDKVDPATFLPATRSIAFTKDIVTKLHGFDERFSNNEDYVFAKKLKSENAKIVFQKNAVAYWIPRSNLKDAYHMMWRFALGDAEAGIYRPKVVLVFIRYILGLLFVLMGVILQQSWLLILSGILLILYILWSIWKNYTYVKDVRAFFFLPLLQFAADLAVLSGTVRGLLGKKK